MWSSGRKTQIYLAGVGAYSPTCCMEMISVCPHHVIKDFIFLVIFFNNMYNTDFAFIVFANLKYQFKVVIIVTAVLLILLAL